MARKLRKNGKGREFGKDRRNYKWVHHSSFKQIRINRLYICPAFRGWRVQIKRIAGHSNASLSATDRNTTQVGAITTP